MTRKLKSKPLLMSIPQTAGSPASLLEPRQLLTKTEPVITYQQQNAAKDMQSTKPIYQSFANTTNANSEQARIFADMLTTAVKGLRERQLLTLGKLADGRRVIILPSTVWNDEMRLK